MKTIIKRINHFMAAGVLALSAVLGTIVLPQQATAMGGDGNPWIIQSCNDLRDMALGVSAFTSDLDYELGGNIDCDGVEMFPISFGDDEAFTGTFDGKGYTISNLTLGAVDEPAIGLFFDLRGTVQNLTLANVDITGRGQVGALAAFTDGATIENVHVTSGTVTGSGNYANDFNQYGIGGLVGHSYDTSYYNVTTNVTVDAPHNSDVGGLIGYSEADEIEQGGTYGTVVGGRYVGGMIGYTDESWLFWVHAKGNVTGILDEDLEIDGSDVGGLVGAGWNVTIATAYARGNVTGAHRVGGLIGDLINDSSLSFSYSTGTITLTSEGDAGGLIGHINSEGGADIGENTFWDEEASGWDSNPGGTVVGLSTAEMKTLSTFTDVGWDFDEAPYWALISTFNDGYPCHPWEEGCEAGDGGDNEGEGSVEIDGNIANLTTATGNKAVTLTVDESCELSSVSAINVANTTAKDAGYTYALGFVQFTASGCDDGVAHVQLLYHGVSPDDLTVRKYNPNKSSFFTITGATITKVGNDTLVTYTIEDGGDLDIDDDKNGVIVDPVGLGSLAVGAPNTGLGGRR